MITGRGGTEPLPHKAGEAQRGLQGHIPSRDSPDQQRVLDAELNDRIELLFPLLHEVVKLEKSV